MVQTWTLIAVLRCPSSWEIDLPPDILAFSTVTTWREYRQFLHSKCLNDADALS